MTFSVTNRPHQADGSSIIAGRVDQSSLQEKAS